MTLLDQIYTAQRNAGEAACIANLQGLGLVTAPTPAPVLIATDEIKRSGHSKNVLTLYKAINNLVSHIGFEGQIESDHGFVSDATNALAALDGGIYWPSWTEQAMSMLEMLQAAEAQKQEIERLRGEAGVMRGLLTECANVILAIDSESEDESDQLDDLHEKIVLAIRGTA